MPGLHSPIADSNQQQVAVIASHLARLASSGAPESLQPTTEYVEPEE